MGEGKSTAEETTWVPGVSLHLYSELFFLNFSMLLPHIYFPRLTMKLFSQTSSYYTDSNPTVTLFETT